MLGSALAPVGLATPAGAASGDAVRAVTAAAAGNRLFSHQARAYGTRVKVRGTLPPGSGGKSGPTANSVFGCTTIDGLDRSNTIASVNLPTGLGTTGAADTTASTDRYHGSVASRSRSVVQQASLLEGRISARSILVRARTSRASGDFVNDAAAEFVGLTVDGRTVDESPPPNSQIALPGIGTLYINERVAAKSADKASLTVKGLRVNVEEENLLGLPVGSNIIIGRASSGLTGPVRALVGRYAYATRLKVGSEVRSGRTALKYLSCTGTDGKIRTNTAGAITIPDALTTGSAESRVQGTVTPESAAAKTVSRVASVRALDQLVRAKAVTAKARAILADGGRTLTSKGSSFVDLQVQGRPGIGDNVRKNTRVEMAGVGTLWLKRVIKTRHQIEVRMIDLEVTENGTSLPIGAKLRIGVAISKVR